jgi:hypothetical protein
VTLELAPGIYGGETGLAAYLAFLGLDSLEELEEKQLQLDLGEDSRYERAA